MNVSLPSPPHGYSREDQAAFRREVERHFSAIRTPVMGTGVPSTPPTLSTAPGRVGTITWDATHLYVCIADATWVRCTLATW